MKKYLMKGFAAIVFCGAIASCSHDMDSGSDAVQSKVQETYEKAFVTRFGTPASTQTWGFGSDKAATRSVNNPECPDITQPYDEAWVTNYLTTASEPTASNVSNNDANATLGIQVQPVMPNFSIGNKPNYCQYNQSLVTPAEIDFYNNTFAALLNAYNTAPQEYNSYNNEENYVTVNNAKIDKFLALYNAVVDFVGEAGVADWLNITTIPVKGSFGAGDFVTNFKITQDYTGTIGVAASEGSQYPGSERTIVVTGTWNITENQKIGSLGKIIIANGGTVNVANSKKLNMVNQAQLVVLSGGTLTGEGSVEINNGTAEGYEAYNGGTIDVNYFNNNFGKFYNYGKFLVNEYDAGATESNFYNHGLVNIDHTGNTPNARIFNNCQFYVRHNARLRNYEGVNGSALIVGGQLMPFGSEDGTTIPSFVSLAAGALVKCGSLYNGSSWVGPTDRGYAALEIVNQIDYMTWVQDSPQTAGYFANNIYVKCGTWENDPTGQGKHFDGPISTEWDQINYNESRAEYKFWSVAANCTGNGNVTKVVESDNVVWPADDDFVLGEDGCTPGFTGDVPPEEEVDEIVVLAEDLTIDDVKPDFDFNDVVFKVTQYKSGAKSGQVWVTLLAAGGTLPLTVDGHEVHEEFANANPDKTILVTTMINTAKNGHTAYKTASFQVTNPSVSSVSNIQEIANNIPVVVTKFGEQIPLVAPTGGVPSKIAVKTDFLTDPDMGWCDERKDIDEKYHVQGTPLFKSYVRGELDDNWYTLIKTKGN